MCNSPNAIQFPRLLAEIMATQNLDMGALAKSMDSTIEDVCELFDRADKAWESNKQALQQTPPKTMTGLMISLNGGNNWTSVDGVRVMFQDANEADDEMEGLLVNVTPEGVILDVTGQSSGEISSTASLPLDYLIALTR